jgi:cell division protein FtsZ
MLSLKESFLVIDKTVPEMIINILESLLIKSDENINLDFEDIQIVFGCKGFATIGVAESYRENSVYNIVEQAIKFSLFDNVNILDAMNILIIIKVHPNFIFIDIDKVLSIFDNNKGISIILSTATDYNLALDYVKVTVVATGFETIMNKAVNNILY